MNAVWIALSLLIPAVLLWRFLHGRDVDHGFLLTFGAYFYIVMPFFAYASGAYSGGPGDDVWEGAFSALYRRSEWALLALAMGLAWLWAGSRLAGQTGLGTLPRGLDRALHPAVAGSSLIALSGLWLVFLNDARELLFSGYLISYRPDLMGPLATLNLALLMLVLNLMQWRQSRLLLVLASLLLAANSVALLSMGGRLYVAAVLVGLFVQFCGSRNGRRPAVRLIGLGSMLVLALALTLVGLWRSDVELNAQSLGHILLAEGVLSSISLSSMLDCPPADWLAVPYNFMSSLLNFVPSGLLPDKEELLVGLDPSGNCLASPFGATHLGAALLMNFGWLGSVLALFGLGWLLQSIKGRKPSWWLYSYLCALLPFMLFRDGFLIFNKAFFASGLLFAVVLVVLSRWCAGVPIFIRLWPRHRMPSTSMQQRTSRPRTTDLDDRGHVA